MIATCTSLQLLTSLDQLDQVELQKHLYLEPFWECLVRCNVAAHSALEELKEGDRLTKEVQKIFEMSGSMIGLAGAENQEIEPPTGAEKLQSV